MSEQLPLLQPQPEPNRAVNLETIECWLTDHPMWMDGYLFLRAKGARYRDAILAVWLSLGRDDRGDIKTRDDLAVLLGISRATTYQWEARRPIRDWAEKLLLRRLCGSRLADVDEATYKAALDGKAADRRLYYQRGQVLVERQEIEHGLTDVDDVFKRALTRAYGGQEDEDTDEGT